MKKYLLLLITLILIIGVSPIYAESRFSVENGSIQIKEDKLDIRIVYPHFEGFDDANELNKRIKDEIADSIGEARASALSIRIMEEDAVKLGMESFGPSARVILNINYDYMKKEDIVSVQLNSDVYMGGVYEKHKIGPITVNTRIGRFYNFKGLFMDEENIIKLNGEKIDSQLRLYKNDKTLLPLRIIAEALGYEVDWNNNDGAIVAGGFIKDGINSYWSSDTEVVSLVAPVVVNNTTYVPIEYFTEVLRENVFIEHLTDDKIVIRIYTKSDLENRFGQSIKNFTLPIIKEEAVHQYAEAIKLRNGSIQYGLMSDELRQEKYDELNKGKFITGTSSPWISNYEIIQIGDNNYRIVFNSETKVIDNEFEFVVDLELKKVGQYWRITSLEDFWKES